MNPKKFATLLYMDDNIDYDPDYYANDIWKAEWYYIVQQMPLAEMLGTKPTEMVEEFIQLTTTGEWQQQQRRPMRCGDIVNCGTTAWLLVKKADIDCALKLAVWPEFGIVMLPETKLEDLLCVQTT